MFQLFYQLLWLVAIILLSPIYLYRVLVQGKYRESTFARLGKQKIPNLRKNADFSNKKIIWIHSVSLGESQIADQFAKTLKENNSNFYIVASSCTETGQAVLKKSQHIDFSFYYPADFIFLIKNLFKRLKPDTILIMETDLWPNMLRIADKKSVPVFLLNAKISENSFNTYFKFPFLKKLLLDPIDQFYVQCTSYNARFEHLGVESQRRTLTGNIKLDRHYPQKSEAELDTLADSLGLNRQHPILVFASSHEGEEQGFIQISQALNKKIPGLQSVFVPRHPERFSEVANLLKQHGIQFNRSSELKNMEVKNCHYLLVDQMGVLMNIYALSTIAVVAGSFTKKVGGHNIFEPAFFSKPIVYGPWIFKQPGFHDLIQEHHAAIQVQDEQWIGALEQVLKELLADETQRQTLANAAFAIIEQSQGVSALIVNDLIIRLPALFK